MLRFRRMSNSNLLECFFYWLLVARSYTDLSEMRGTLFTSFNLSFCLYKKHYTG